MSINKGINISVNSLAFVIFILFQDTESTLLIFLQHIFIRILCNFNCEIIMCVCTFAKLKLETSDV